MKTILCQATAVAVIFVCCFTTSLSAQKSNDAIGVAKAPVEFCDILLPIVEQELQDEANATCTTQYGCVECMERTRRMVLAATLVAQPTDPDCKPITEIKTEEDAKSRGAIPATAKSQFHPKILQSPCINGGTNLSIYIPGYGQDSREFSYLWEVDGNKGGHLTDLNCACGKEARVRVTRLATGESVTLVAKLGTGCGSSDRK